MNDVWPWAITPLTARAISAWLFGLGLIQLQAVIENAWERIDVVVINYVLGGALQLVAIARFSDDLRWDGNGVWVYVAAVVSVLAMGVLGLIEMRRLRS